MAKNCTFSGIVNFLGRLVGGVLFDRLGYSRLMSATGLLLAINLATIYTAGQHIIGLMTCVWLVYFLGFAHFSTIPAQVRYQRYKSNEPNTADLI